MRLDLKDIIEVPGGSVDFACELETDRLGFPSVKAYRAKPHAEGRVYNEAGVLHLEGELTAEMTCVCDRCGTVFDREKVLPLDVPLSADVSDETSPEVFAIEGDGIDVSEVAETCFILNMEQKVLCRDDCKGLCPHCGKNLNDGPCDCVPTGDPRLAVLQQLPEAPENPKN